MKRSRYRNRTGQRKIPLLGVLGICFGAALLIALIIGLILNASLDEETYYRLTTKPRNKQDDTILFVPSISDVIAQPYSFGESLSEIGGAAAVSLALNNSDGTYLYSSDALDYFQKGKSGGAALDMTLASLSNARVYVSGIFYPTSCAEKSPDLRYAKEAVETAAAKEFFHLGGNDMILCGLDLSGGTSESVSYIKQLKLAVGQKAVGVALSYEVLLREDSGTILERILSVCDFVALDLRQAATDKPLDEVLGATTYSYAQYHLRLLFSQKQNKWVADAQSMGIVNYEILK
ncbi:MAG: hypothetical protein IJR88_02965 [Clostridia bacterium]|nr:hypothetical protein [Clostridia bacterium]